MRGWRLLGKGIDWLREFYGRIRRITVFNGGNRATTRQRRRARRGGQELRGIVHEKSLIGGV